MILLRIHVRPTLQQIPLYFIIGLTRYSILILAISGVARTAKSTGCLRHLDKRKSRVGIGVPWETWSRVQKKGSWEVVLGHTVPCLISVIIVHRKGNAGGVVLGQSFGRFSRGSHSGIKD